MRNPLNRRFLRDLKSDAAKYVSLFLFLTLFIGAISGFFVSDKSVVDRYYESHEELNVEDGHLGFNMLPDEGLLRELETSNNLKFCPLFYKEEKLEETGNTVRIYKVRDSLNLICVLSGALPANENEIALDRMYAENNGLSVGDTLTVCGRAMKLSGLTAVPDYSCLFENNSDMMFDAVNFGIAFLLPTAYSLIGDAHESFNYAYKFNTKVVDDRDANERSKSLVTSLEKSIREYDEKLVKDRVNKLYADAKKSVDTLTAEFSSASTEITKKFSLAFLTGGFISDTIMAQRLGIGEDEYRNLRAALEKAEKLGSELDSFNTPPEIDFENVDENELDMSKFKSAVDEVKGIIEAVDSSGLYNCAKMMEAIEAIDPLLETKIDDELLTVTDYNPKYTNKAINFVIDDAASDKAASSLMLYIIIAVIAFIFAVSSSNTVAREAPVIGTLRASGYSRGELVRHYMFMPLLTTLAAALIGNILGYTVFEKMFVGVYYGNYSLVDYRTSFSANAFIETTVAPLVLMLVINALILWLKLRISPLNFLRGNLSKRRNRHVFKLPKGMPIFSRFRLRILFSNLPSYLTLFVGIVLAGMLIVFGSMFGPLMEDYTELVNETKLASYQYVLKEQVEIADTDAEKCCLTTLETTDERFIKDEVMIYGINEGSRYVTEKIPSGTVLVSNGMMDKFGLKVGDTISLRATFGDETYSFSVGGDYNYDAAISVFMNREDYLNTFGEDEDYFTGYLSNRELSEVDAEKVAMVITEEDLTKIVTQLGGSLLPFMIVFRGLGIVLFLLVMFILTKQILERNIGSIAMSKVLGFSDGEIGKLYLVITSFVVLASLLVSIPIIDALLRWLFHSYMYTEMTGYIPYIVSPSCFVMMVILGIVAYAAVAAGMMLKLRKMPKSEALKNQSL